MIERPSQRWRHEVAREEAAVAAGMLPREEANAAEFWPLAFVEAVETALVAYEREIEQLPDRDRRARVGGGATGGPGVERHRRRRVHRDR